MYSKATLRKQTLRETSERYSWAHGSQKVKRARGLAFTKKVYIFDVFQKDVNFRLEFSHTT